jgi:CO/xanthine dehydrogenase FAD-binding subunit
MPSVSAVGARTRCTYRKRMQPATAENRLAGSRSTPDTIDATAHAANDGIAFTGDAFGAAAYLAELFPIYVSRALSQIATPPIPTE